MTPLMSPGSSNTVAPCHLLSVFTKISAALGMAEISVRKSVNKRCRRRSLLNDGALPSCQPATGFTLALKSEDCRQSYSAEGRAATPWGVETIDVLSLAALHAGTIARPACSAFECIWRWR